MTVTLSTHTARGDVDENTLATLHDAGLNLQVADAALALGVNFADLLNLFPKYGPTLFALVQDVQAVKSASDLWPLAVKYGPTLWAFLQDLQTLLANK